ncbi:hypothetical protein IPP92_01675 [Candidatus Saccharibacteria bacterium]|nr:MAG: hypothetical protein IPP92_01675 [Candidatus Saccharibacteria bacterium]
MPTLDSVPVLCDPLDAFEPVQPPVPPAVQLVGLFVTLHERVAALPTFILLGVIVSETFGLVAVLPEPVFCVGAGVCGSGFTTGTTSPTAILTTAKLVALPVEQVNVNKYIFGLSRLVEVSLPCTDLSPDQSSLAEHRAELSETLQVRVTFSPMATACLSDVSVIDGITGTVSGFIASGVICPLVNPSRLYVDRKLWLLTNMLTTIIAIILRIVTIDVRATIICVNRTPLGS